MAKITKVPNGPLVKKKGPFKGSTLKNGGATTTTKQTTKNPDAQSEYITQQGKNYVSNRKVNTPNGPRYYQATSPNMSFARELSHARSLGVNDSIPKAKLSARAIEMMNQKNGGKVKKAKAGGMIKRADGSYSKRGLWDNIRANKGSGKKPTKQMLVQEKKIKAKTKK